MKATTVYALSLANLIGLRVVDPTMQPVGRVIDIRTTSLQGQPEAYVQVQDKTGAVRKVAWADAVISPERGIVMIAPERVG